MKLFDAESFFAGLPLFKNAPAAELRGLAARAVCLEFGKGRTILVEGDPADAAWWVAEGIVKISKVSPQGKPVTLEMLTRGDVFAPAGIMPLESYPANAVAVTPVSVLRVLKPELQGFIRAFPVLPQNVLSQISARLQRAHRLRAMDGAAADKKVAAALLWLAEKTGSTLGVSRREIAEIAGVAPETAIRAALDFKKKKWISFSGRAMKIARLDALRKYVEADA